MASDKSNEHLFPGPRGQASKHASFNKALNRLGRVKNICDESGKLWRFQPHQFRHTVGTRMINNGVPQIMVQKFLGHESPGMTSVYAHIHDKTLKEEYEAFLQRRGKLVDVTGQAVEHELSADIADLQWFKKHVQAQRLPNGYCALPVVQGECPHSNACLTCGNFRTDSSFLEQHKAQLNATQQLVQISRTNNWTRQTEMNAHVALNLKKIISVLEEQKSNEKKKT